MSFIVAIDTGGTFTDLAAYDRRTGRFVYTKSLTDYAEFTEGVIACLRKAAVGLDQTDFVKFGTTLVINTYIQRNGARTALVTTEGFRDVLEIRRGNRPIPFDLRFAWDPPLVPRSRRREVAERLAADGSVVRPLDRDALAALCEVLRAEAVEAVAVSFVNAYANPAHEEEAAALIRAALPDVYVTAGTELSREWYEYERSSTAAANAYVGPKLKHYVARLEGRLRSDGFARQFYLMGSNGGVLTVPRAQEQPVMLVESGPVGGCIGAGAYARALGLDRVIAFDMGGTTAKCAVVIDGVYEVKSPYYVGGPEHGFPVRGAVVDIVEVGAGGGSIAWLDEGGRLNVGPKSAGSSPGPVAYGRGGSEPTMTDANLVLGTIDAASFLGGELALDAAAAAAALRRAVADPLGFAGADALDLAAQGVVDLGVTVMAGAIKQVSVERGYDPRDFALFVFGGGGPLHGAALARELGIPSVIVPPQPGIFSALGMLLADARVDHTTTFVRDLDAEAVAAMRREFAALEARVTAELADEAPAAAIRFERQAEMRYRGQRQFLKAPMGDAVDTEAVRAAFEAAYSRRYGHVDEAGPLEFVNLILTATAPVERPALERLVPATGAPAPAEPASRPVFFAQAGARVDTPVHRRDALPVGFAAPGPALIEEYGSTTVVGPGDRFAIGRLGEIRIEIGQ